MEQPTACDYCGFDGPVGGLKEYRPRFAIDPQGNPKNSRWMCGRCANSLGPEYDAHVDLDYGFTITVKTVCYCANEVLKAIEEAKV